MIIIENNSVSDEGESLEVLGEAIKNNNYLIELNLGQFLLLFILLINIIQLEE